MDCLMMRREASWTIVAEVAINMTVQPWLQKSAGAMSARSRSVLLNIWTGVDIGGVESVPVAVD